MPIISPTAISPHRIGGKNLRSYWATLISATVETAAPTHVVLTFPTAQTSLLATDITATVNGVARAVSSASWTGAVWTVVLASAVEYADVIVMTFVPSGGTTTVTNNVLTYAALLTSIGTGAGVSTLRMEVSSNITVTLGANAKFYSDAAGTADESDTWTITSGALRTIYLKCTTGTATMTFSDTSKIIKVGGVLGNEGWISGENAARWTITAAKLTEATTFYIIGTSTILGALPAKTTYLVLYGDGISWTYNGALPTGLTSMLYINSTSVAWTYNGALPTGVTYLYFNGANIAWTYNGALPTGLTYMYITGNNINWTGLAISTTANAINVSLLNYRIAKMSSADMITLLTQMTNRAGTLPTTITINDYADYASPPAGVVAAVNTLKATKGITTVNLGA